MAKKGNTNKRASRKSRDLIRFGIGVATLFLLNYVGQFAFERFDLTAENRYSLTEATKTQLENLDDVVFIRVYLEGDLPAGFKRLRNSTRELLDEFRVYAGNNLQYEFIDPSEDPDQGVRNSIYQDLTKRGLQYTNLQSREGDRYSEQIIFPGAILSFQEREVPLQLLKSQIGADPEVMLNNSIQQLEYELMSAIQKLTNTFRKSIGFVEGHGELDELEVADLTEGLREFYQVERVRIDGRLDALKLYNALIVAGPDSAFPEKDKYMIDQFIMKGGKVLWLVEPVEARMDSLRKLGITLGLPRETNLSDQLFKYGARVNADFVMDLQALPIPVVTGMIGNQPKQELFPWYYFPLLMPAGNHPIVNNLDAIKTEFVSSIDTVGSSSIRKTPLLLSSQYSRVSNAPHRISLNILRDPPNEDQYNSGPQITAVLLEGTFPSVFKNRLPPTVTENPEFRYKEESGPTKMIVISDVDIARNRVNREKQEFYAVGFDRYTQRTYGNKEFLMNCMNYLLNDDGLINARAKEFKIRLLDKQKVERDKRTWQVVNTAVPILLVLIFGLAHATLRKRKYSQPPKS